MKKKAVRRPKKKIDDQTTSNAEHKKIPKKVGRPTKYKEEYCQKLIEHMSQGLSYETFGVTIGVHLDTCYEWEKRHSKFSEAKKIAFNACQLYWELEGKKGMHRKDFNAAIWIYNVKARFRRTKTYGPLEEEKKPKQQFSFKLSYDPSNLKGSD